MVTGMISVSLVRNVEGASNEIVLIGASITEAWHVDGLSARTAHTGFKVTPLVLYEFDKSSLVNSVLNQPAKPRAVIIYELVKGMVTGEKPELGQMRTVDGGGR